MYIHTPVCGYTCVYIYIYIYTHIYIYIYICKHESIYICMYNPKAEYRTLLADFIHFKTEYRVLLADFAATNA